MLSYTILFLLLNRYHSFSNNLSQFIVKKPAQRALFNSQLLNSKQNSNIISKSNNINNKIDNVNMATTRLNKYLPLAKGLVFDYDGTLVDTMPYHITSYELTSAELGIEIPKDFTDSLSGIPEPDIWKNLIQVQKGGKSHITIDDCVKIRKKHFTKMEKKFQMGLISCVVSIARDYHGKIPMAVASSGWREDVLRGLNETGIMDLFNVVVTAEDENVKFGKPAPDIFLVAADKIGVNPEKCIGFEDSNAGIIAVEKASYLYVCDVRELPMYCGL